MRYEIDWTLFNRRRVANVAYDDSLGIAGFRVKLECGHECWCLTEPPLGLFCADCVGRALIEIRSVQKEPIRAGHR
jgi:hypothetical protein